MMISLEEAMRQRHSVRTFTDEPLAQEAVAELQAMIDQLNEDNWLDMQLVLNEPKALNCGSARRAGFQNAQNYLALVGPEGKELAEILGFCGEQVVLLAQRLGINSCWVSQTYKLIDRTMRITFGEKLECIVALGYGTTQGEPHESKKPQEISKSYATAPDWFKAGVDAALLAPTAMNAQRFSFELGKQFEDGTYEVKAKSKLGPGSKVSLGIAMYHFMVGAGEDAFNFES